MKAITLFAALFLSGISVNCQNLIGYKYSEIRNYMNQNRSEMNYNDVTNSKYNYLKYTDNSDSQTLLFFLNQDSVCKSIRMICDAGKKAEKTKEFNTIYIKYGKKRWIDVY